MQKFLGFCNCTEEPIHWLGRNNLSRCRWRKPSSCLIQFHRTNLRNQQKFLRHFFLQSIWPKTNKSWIVPCSPKVAMQRHTRMQKMRTFKNILKISFQRWWYADKVGKCCIPATPQRAGFLSSRAPRVRELAKSWFGQKNYLIDPCLRWFLYLVDHFVQDNRIKSGFAWFLSLFSRAVLRLKHPPKVGPVVVIVMIIVIIGIVVVISIPKYDLCGSCWR